MNRSHGRSDALAIGSPLPHVNVKSSYDMNSAIGNVAGRYTIFCIFGRADHEESQSALQEIVRNVGLHDEVNRAIVVVSSCRLDSKNPLLEQLASQKIIVVWDHDLEFVSALGLCQKTNDRTSMTPVWILADPMYRVAGLWPLKDKAAAFAVFAATAHPDQFAGVPLYAPILIVPRIFESDMCARLIGYYLQRDGEVSGIARDILGKTENVDVPTKKRRLDCTIDDGDLRKELTRRLVVRLFPQIEKAFRYKVTRIERYIVACYDADRGGYFRTHRDTTSAATSHRAFAATINLNAESFEGCDLRFPEYGSRTYRAPTGGAIVFSCALLHEATPITRGQRFAFLPFLYNEEGEEIRQGDRADNLGE